MTPMEKAAEALHGEYGFDTEDCTLCLPRARRTVTTFLKAAAEDEEFRDRASLRAADEQRINGGTSQEAILRALAQEVERG